ncbi:unnamed protein product [Camellia sinensis]
MEVVGRRRRSYTRRSKRPSSWTSQPPPIPTLATIVTGSVCVSGCDQKHEDEMDPEAISKNFVLQVMAARSPNIRLHKALNKKASSVNEKCPLSGPAKPSTSRISRLAVISSFSQKMGDARGKVKQLLSKLSSTPNPKVKQVAAKYLTTPRNKNCLPSLNSFRSVQNLKPTNIAEPKNRTVAKALVLRTL